MSYVVMDARPVDLILCPYGNSKNLFRDQKNLESTNMVFV